MGPLLRTLTVLVAILLGLAGAAAILLRAPAFREELLVKEIARGQVPAQEIQEAELKQRRTRIRDYERRHAALTPRRSYLVIDTPGNRFALMDGTRVQRAGVCSTGSYVMLKSNDDRQWIFRTPRGRYFIQLKKTNPVWVKPDWAFIEEGLPVPGPGARERYEPNVLGDYAMSIGDGYLIHGTLYQRLLGQPVTHGCIRLGDADLEAIYNSLAVGSPVYIY
jgi:L,D-transpeptidase ErfK/SrfK